jgi:hypothetical protein
MVKVKSGRGPDCMFMAIHGNSGAPESDSCKAA